MAQTRPTGEQLRFRSENTGDHILDTYLEAAEVGGRSIQDLLEDLFDPNTSGQFRADNFEFRFDSATDKIQFRVGQFATSTSGWTDITSFFNIRGDWVSMRPYKNFDLVTTSDRDVYIVHGISSQLATTTENAFKQSYFTTKIVDVSEARDWATKTDGQVSSTDYSAKAWAVGGTGVTDTATRGAAKEWATETASTVDGTEYSAKEYAVGTQIRGTTGSAKDWAQYTAGTVDGTNYSAKYWATNADVGTVAGIATDIQTLADIEDGTTATNAIQNVASIYTDVTTVAGQISPANNINTVAGLSPNISTVAAINQQVQDVAANITPINSVAGQITPTNNIGALGPIASSIANVSGISTELVAVEGISTEITTLYGIRTDVSTVAGIASDVTTAAQNVVAFNNTYLGAQSGPPSADPDGSALDTGDLYFDTVQNVMKVYSSSGWINASSSVNGTSNRFTFTATANQTTFTGLDNNSNTLLYDSGFVDVYLNGIRLVVGDDVTATTGNTLVLTVGAAAGDTLDVIAFGAFSLSNILLDDLQDVNIIPAHLADGVGLKWSNSLQEWRALPVMSTLDADSTPQLGGDLGTNSFDINVGVSSAINVGLSNELVINRGNFNTNTWGQLTFNGDGYINVNGGGLYMKAGNSAFSPNIAYFVDGGAVSLYYDGGQKFQTTTTGINITGEVVADSAQIDGDLAIDGGQLTLPDLAGSDNKIIFGSGNDVAMYYSGTADTLFLNMANNGSTSDFTIQPYTGGMDFKIAAPGSVGGNNFIIQGNTTGGECSIDISNHTHAARFKKNGSNYFSFSTNSMDLEVPLEIAGYTRQGRSQITGMSAGDLIYITDDQTLEFYNGTDWRTITNAAAPVYLNYTTYTMVSSSGSYYYPDGGFTPAGFQVGSNTYVARGSMDGNNPGTSVLADGSTVVAVRVYSNPGRVGFSIYTKGGANPTTNDPNAFTGITWADGSLFGSIFRSSMAFSTTGNNSSWDRYWEVSQYTPYTGDSPYTTAWAGGQNSSNTWTLQIGT